MPLPLANPPAQSRASSRLRPAGGAPVARLAAPAPLRLWHLASLDAPTVAAVWSLGFAWAAGVRLPRWVPMLLALGTWSVYIGDRLLDARAGLRSGASSQLRERHFFHWRHRRTWFRWPSPPHAPRPPSSLSCMPAGPPRTQLSAGRRRPGLLLRRPLAPPPPAWLAPLLSKEFLVGVLFTAGCALPALLPAARIPATAARPRGLSPAVVFFAALAWLNCHAIERWESRRGVAHRSLASLLGLAGLLLAVLLPPHSPAPAALLAAGAASALCWPCSTGCATARPAGPARRRRPRPAHSCPAAPLLLLARCRMKPRPTSTASPAPIAGWSWPASAPGSALPLRLSRRTAHLPQRAGPRRRRWPLHRPPAPRKSRRPYRRPRRQPRHAARPGPQRRRRVPAASACICADARLWEPPAARYDLIVTHFFLDCLTTGEVAALAARLRPCATARSRCGWSRSSPCPQDWFGWLVARPVVAGLYLAFGLLTGLAVHRLPNHRKALARPDSPSAAASATGWAGCW